MKRQRLVAALLCAALGASAALAFVPASTASGPAAVADAAARGSLSVNRSEAFPGERVVFSGRLVRGKVNQRAVLQVRRDEGWRPLDFDDHTNRRGRFRIVADLDLPVGSHSFRVLGQRSRLYEVPRLITSTVAVRLDARPGSRDLPWRPGQAFDLDGWRFTFAAADLDAWPERQAHYDEADPPPPGWAYISVLMTFTRLHPDSGRAWIDTNLRYVGGDGIVYRPYESIGGRDYACSLADDWSDAPEMYAGATASGSECIVVRQTAIEGGMWRIDDGIDGEQFVTVD